MKIIFAPDSFKGTLSAQEIIDILTRTALRHDKDAACLGVAAADGGEGTVRALVETLGGSYRSARVHGPLGDETEALWGVLPGDVAVMEMAQASGLPLIEGRKNPLRASSEGTGELVRAILDAGYRTILVGLGGSATNDGGMGCLKALGMRFYDQEGVALYGRGQDLARVERVDGAGLDSRVREAHITVICDVTNLLLGEAGATAVYGPQKGVTADLFPVLEEGMAHYARVMENAGFPVEGSPGCGAAGGLGGAFRGALGAQLKRGIDAVLEAAHFDAMLEDADLVVTGEGKLDTQSVRHGKVVSGILDRARKKGVPVVILPGTSLVTCEETFGAGPGSILATLDRTEPQEKSIARAREAFMEAAERMFRLLDIGRGIAEKQRASKGRS